jgi:iron(III) transport system permease protein
MSRIFIKATRSVNTWTWLTLAIAALTALPAVVVLWHLLMPAPEVWTHLTATVLPRYLGNTFLLAAGVGIGVLLVGVGAAWLVAMCRFPGRRLFEWALMLPLAMPTYVIAYAYTDFLQFTGPVQTGLRETFGWGRDDYLFPEIRSLPGAIALMSLVLYPYVYLLARAAFLEQSAGALEAARTLGRGPWRAFLTVAVPLARPAIAGGVALALMETLNDFGAVQFFGIDTFTTGIYRTWFGLGEPVAAAQLAACLLLIVMLLLVAERLTRGRGRVAHAGRRGPPAAFRLDGARAALAVTACALPIALGFGLPAVLLAAMAVDVGDPLLGTRFVDFALNSLTLAAAAAAVTVALAVALGYGMRLSGSRLTGAAGRLAAMGYAVPGSVIAVGILIPLGRVDATLHGWLEPFGLSSGLLLTGTVFALVYAYAVRFLAVSLNGVEASLGRITPTMDAAARSLGCTGGRTLRRVHLPLMRGSLAAAALLVFVDVMKELPATVILRPFNFDTLAVRAYSLASDERLAQAATASLAIVAVGILPVILLNRAMAQARPTGPMPYEPVPYGAHAAVEANTNT